MSRKPSSEETLALPPADEEEGPATAGDKHRHMVVLPTASRDKLFEMAAEHNCNPSSIVHMALEWFHTYGPFRHMYARRRSGETAGKPQRVEISTELLETLLSNARTNTG